MRRHGEADFTDTSGPHRAEHSPVGSRGGPQPNGFFSSDATERQSDGDPLGSQHGFDNRHEHGILPASHHGMAPQQMAAMFAKMGKQISTQSAPRKSPRANLPAVMASKPKVPAAPKPKAVAPHPTTPHAPKVHAPAKHAPGGHAKPHEGGEKAHPGAIVGKVLSGAAKSVKEAGKATVEASVAATGTEQAIKSAKADKHHMGFSEAGVTHHFSYGGTELS